MRTFLVTGGAGLVGSHLVETLLARGDAVVALDDLSTGRRDNLRAVAGHERLRFVEGSACDERLVDELLAGVDGCFHLASLVGVELVVQRTLEALLTNVRGAEVVIHRAAAAGVPLLFSSSSEVYGKPAAVPLREGADAVLGASTSPRWSYAVSKLFGEALCLAEHRERGAATVVARLFNTVGPRQRGDYGMVLPRLVRQALTGEELTVYGDGRQTRCFCHVLDVVEALAVLIDEPAALGSVLNVGSTEEIAILDLAERVIERAGAGAGIRHVPLSVAYGARGEEPARRRPDIDAVERLIGWRPRRSLDEAIDDVIAHERSALDERPDGVVDLVG